MPVGKIMIVAIDAVVIGMSSIFYYMLIRR